MPVVKVFVPPSLLPSDPVDVTGFGSAVGDVCLDVLRASPQQIQVMVVPAHAARGAPIYMEIHFRDTAYRDADVVSRFMAQLEVVVQTHFNATPRIRCFAEDQAFLHARN